LLYSTPASTQAAFYLATIPGGTNSQTKNKTNMKKLLLLTAYCILLTAYCQAQCSITVCEKTGAYAYSYNDSYSEVSTMRELKEISLKACQKAGGKDCQNYYETEEAGWCAFFIKDPGVGRFFIGITAGHDTREEAIDAARKGYREGTGKDASNLDVKAWKVYVY